MEFDVFLLARKKLRLFCISLVSLFLLSATAPVFATTKKVALVVGNGAYQNVPPLSNPINDAAVFADRIEKLGFETIRYADLSAEGFRKALREFAQKIVDADVSLFFYAGHGLQVESRNYLAAVDAHLENETDLLFESLELDDVLRVMEASTSTRLLFLDACRNNPLANNLTNQAGSRSVSVGRGLARVSAGAGTLIAYATAPGEVANDGSGQNSPFTSALVRHIGTPGLDVALMLRKVRQEVAWATNGSQIPWSTESLMSDFYFASSAPEQKTNGKTKTRLAIDTTPPDAKVRILNIPNEYTRNMELEPGRYHVEVSADGFEPWVQWRDFGPGNNEVAVTLTPNPVDAMTSEMTFIEAGCFRMGSPETEEERDPDERGHQVCVDGFWIGKHEITVEQFRSFTESTSYTTDAEANRHNRIGCLTYETPSGRWIAEYRANRGWDYPGFLQEELEPVVCVSYHDALAYARWLSESTGHTYRLPTEAEWEYSARAGTDTSRFWGDTPEDACRYANIGDRAAKREWTHWSNVHNCDDNSRWTSAVGSYEANPWGLHDVMGNVAEWTCSAYAKKYNGDESTCEPPLSDRLRVVRGGNWGDSPLKVRSASRNGTVSQNRHDVLGFRLVRTE